MYNRSQKENFRKKIEELIGGRGKQKRSRKDDTTTIDDNSNDNANNDNINNDLMISNDTETSSSVNKIHVQRWISGNTKIEGIRKY
jgi:hypothetical protein